jgi:hypothetical protein
MKTPFLEFSQLRMGRFWISCLVLLSLGGCSTARIYDGKPTAVVALNALRLRRPVAPSAEHGASEGGQGFRSEVLPDAQGDCQTPELFFSALSLKEVRECFKQIPAGVRLRFDLERSVQPRLILSEDAMKSLNSKVLGEGGAAAGLACVVRLLGSIPVPREVFAVLEDARAARQRECRSIALDSEGDRFLGAKLPVQKKSVSVVFPLDASLESEEDVRHLLLTWCCFRSRIWVMRSSGFGRACLSRGSSVAPVMGESSSLSS